MSRPRGPGTMTIAEAARLGGLACRDKHGLDHYRRLGAEQARRPASFYRAIGRLGGAAMRAKVDAAERAAWSRKGGAAPKPRHW